MLYPPPFGVSDVAVDNTYEIRYTLGVKSKLNRFRINQLIDCDFRTDSVTISPFRNEVNGLIVISESLWKVNKSCMMFLCNYAKEIT